MDLNMMVYELMIRRMDLVSINGPMEISMMGFGKMIK